LLSPQVCCHQFPHPSGAWGCPWTRRNEIISTIGSASLALALFIFIFNLILKTASP
jgi:hypothetical protein